MPPIHVINLRRSEDRWNKIRGQLDSLNLQAHRLEAVEGRALSKTQLLACSSPLTVAWTTPGMIGCFVSHQRFWQAVLDDTDCDCAIVLEDDVQLEPKFQETVIMALQMLPKDWDVCLLGALGCAHPDGTMWQEGLLNYLLVLYMGGTRPCRLVREQGGVKLFVPRKPCGTHCYLISRRGAAKLLQFLPRATYHIDHVAWHSALPIDLYAVHPFVANQDVTAVSTLVANHRLPSTTNDEATTHLNHSGPRQWWDSIRIGGSTGQSLGHVMAEPLVRLPFFGVLSVGLHQFLVATSVMAGIVLLRSQRTRQAGVIVLGFITAFVIAIHQMVHALVRQSFNDANRTNVVM